MDKRGGQLVVKNNELNYFTFYKSSVQLKIFSKLILEIIKDPDKQIYRVPIKDLMRDISYEHNNYQKLKKLVLKMGKMIEIPQEKGFRFSALFYDIKTRDASYLDFEVNPNLKPYIIELNNNFTSYYFKNIVKLKSYYSIRIYELLKQYQQKDGNGWWVINTNDLREILKIDNSQYKLYGDFKRKVILQAQSELSEKTDISFTFEEYKTGRKITSIKFFISATKKGKEDNSVIGVIEEHSSEVQTTIKPLLDPIINDNIQTEPKQESFKDDKDKFKILKDFGFTSKDINNIKKNYSEEAMLSNAQYTLVQVKKGNVLNAMAYFRKALKDNYALSSQIGTNNIIDNSQEPSIEEDVKKIKDLEQQKRQDERLILELVEKLKEFNQERFNYVIENSFDKIYILYNEEREKEKLNIYKQNSFNSLQEIKKEDFKSFLTFNNDKELNFPLMSFKATLFKKNPNIQLNLIEYIELRKITVDNKPLKVEKKEDGSYIVIR